MRRDDRVFVIGEDVGVYGGAFKVTKGFQDEFGEWRVIDAPLAETAIVGACTGAAMMGMRPVAEMQFADFISCAGITSSRSPRSSTTAPARPSRSWCAAPRAAASRAARSTRRTPSRAFAHIPGLKIVCPSTPADAKGLLISSIRDDNPVLYFEHKHLYRRIKGEVPEGDVTRRPSASRAIAREGERHHVVTWGAMVHTALDAAAERLADRRRLEVEVIDLRTIMPWDARPCSHSVARTGKALVLHEDTRTAGFGAEIAATIAEEVFE